MRIYTSYFYQIRFFPPNLVPLSTAVWDPKWFHDGKSQSYQFKDKNGVLNGLRAEVFYPRCEGSESEFDMRYRIQLRELDFEDIMQRFDSLATAIKNKEGFEDVDFALIVHEAPSNPHSERVPIQDWFRDHGIQVTEWQPNSI